MPVHEPLTHQPLVEIMSPHSEPFLGEAEEENIGHGIAQRLVRYEISRLQVEFLERLRESPVGQYLTLCGAAALHGVYLHQRWSATLDFEAPYVVVLRLAELARASGLGLEKGMSSNQFVFSGRSLLFPDMRVSIHIYVKHQMVSLPHTQDFLGRPDAPIPVRVLPLEELVATKIGMLFKSPRAIDFVDVWLALSSKDSISEQVHDVLGNAQWIQNSLAPPRPMDASVALRHLRRLQPSWMQALDGVIAPVPTWEKVNRDLQQGLQQLQDEKLR